ncbi:MAG: hypothetical protein AB1589_19370 [Cyanobacteriota bacterium]
MKRLIMGVLSVLLLSTVTAPAAIAQVTTENDGGITNTEYDVGLTDPFTLVTSAYRGEFKEQGIPSYGHFLGDYQSGELDAEDLVQAAVDAGELPPQALNDEGYISAVKLSLGALSSSFIGG